MAFQVKEFHSIQKGTSLDWKFKLINKTATQFNFYELDESSRSLLDLAKDISGQMDTEIQNKKKKHQQKNRIIRKSCQKIIKGLSLSLTSFAKDIGEQLDTVNAFFKKQKLPQFKYLSVLQKCKRWVLSSWLSVDNDDFYKTTEKYINSYVKDGKKMNQDFELLTELYGVVIGENSSTQIEDQQTKAEKLIQIDVNLAVDSKYISECLLYNTDNLSYIKTKNFSEHFVNDILKENNFQGMSKEYVQQLEQQVRIQIRSQCLYKTLLKKYASILLNFSTIQIPSEVKEYLIPINVELKNQKGEVEYEDYFQWDILNDSNSIEEFCQQLIEDAELNPKYFSQLCYFIRTEINSELEWKFMLLVKTFKQIHKDRESPKLNTQTTMMIRKNLPYTMDVLMPSESKSYKPAENLTFANSDVFSLLSRNIDILPEEFQSYFQERDNKDKNSEQMNEKTEANGSSVCKISKKTINLTDVYQNRQVRVQSNNYLSGVNLNQCSNAWKRLLDQKTNAQ